MFSESWQIVWNFDSSLSVTDRVQEHNNNRARAALLKMGRRPRQSAPQKVMYVS